MSELNSLNFEKIVKMFAMKWALFEMRRDDFETRETMIEREMRAVGLGH